MATLFIGQNKVYLPVTDSTNSYAISLLKNVNPPEGMIIYTDEQTAGRGQRGNKWITDSAMNITLSLILKPHFLPVRKSFYLSKIVALAVYDVLSGIDSLSHFDIKIKWPNDIMVNEQKIAGILIENSFKEERFHWAVIGIGLNVNQLNFNGLTHVTSVALLSGIEFERELLMEHLFTQLEKWYLALRNNRYESIDKAYLERLFRLNKISVFEQNTKQFEAKIVGVAESGLLELELSGGMTKNFEVKELKMIY